MMDDLKPTHAAQKLLQEALEGTRTNCKFKAAFIPEGWACVEISTFARDTANALFPLLREEKEDE